MIIFQILSLIGIVYTLKQQNYEYTKLYVILFIFSCLAKINTSENMTTCNQIVSQDSGTCILKDEENNLFECTKGHEDHCKVIDTEDLNLGLCLKTMPNLNESHLTLYNKFKPCGNIVAQLIKISDDDALTYITLKYDDQTCGEYTSEGVYSEEFSTFIKFKEISKIRVFNNNKLTIYSGKNFTGYNIKLPIVANNPTASEPKLYTEYNIKTFTGFDDGINSIKVQNLSKSTIMKHPGMTTNNQNSLEFKYDDKPPNQIYTNEQCINDFKKNRITNKLNYAIVSNEPKKNDNLDAFLEEPIDDIDENKEDKEDNKSNIINTCLHSKFSFTSDNNKSANIIVPNPDKMIIQQIPDGYQTFCNRKVLENSHKLITDDDSKQITMIECGDRCANYNKNNNNSSKCIGFQYANQNNNIPNEIGKCTLINTRFNINSNENLDSLIRDTKRDDYSKYNIYLKNFNIKDSECPSNNINMSDITKEVETVNKSDYFDQIKINDDLDKKTTTELLIKEKRCHDNLVNIYVNPENIIKMSNIKNTFCHTIRFRFNGPVCIANINIIGKGDYFKNKKQHKNKEIDWADNLLEFANISYTSNDINNKDKKNTDINENKLNAIDNNVCTFYKLNTIDPALLEDDDMVDNMNDDDEKIDDDISNKIDKMSKESSFIEITFKNDENPQLVIEVSTIILFVYNTNYDTICNKNTENLPTPGTEYPIQIEFYSGSDKALISQINKQSKNSNYVLHNMLPPLPNENASYIPIQDFGISELYRGWVNNNGGSIKNAFCRFIPDINDPTSVVLKCNQNNGKITYSRSYKKDEIKNIFFANTSEKTTIEDMCKCINTSSIGDQSKIKCVQMDPQSQKNTYVLDHDIDQSCENLNIELVKKIISNKKIDYCGDIHVPFLNSKKYQIDAGFFIKKNSKLLYYIFKNTQINNSDCVLFRIENMQHRAIYNTPCIVCETTFPGLSFNDKRIDRIDAAMVADPEKNHVYFFKTINKQTYVIKYDLDNRRPVCDLINYKSYPVKIEDEFKITKSNLNFFKNPIIGAAYVGTKNAKLCYLFTETEFIYYDLHNFDNVKSSDSRIIYRNPNWPDMIFSKPTTVMSGADNKSLLFFSKNRVTEIKLSDRTAIYQNKEIQKISNWKLIWNFSVNNLASNLVQYNKIYSSKPEECKLPETPEQKVLRLHNEQQFAKNEIESENNKMIEKQVTQQKHALDLQNIKNNSLNNVKLLDKLKENKEIEIENIKTKLELIVDPEERKQLETEIKTLEKDSLKIKSQIIKSKNLSKDIDNVVKSINSSKSLVTKSVNDNNIKNSLINSINDNTINDTGINTLDNFDSSNNDFAEITDDENKFNNIKLNDVLSSISDSGQTPTVIQKNKNNTFNILLNKDKCKL
jgi:hypothetical protein